MKKLILFTNYYPYYKGEEYLETEMDYLVKEFDEIILFPTLLSKNMKLTRKVPGKVNVYPIYYNNTYFDKIKSLFEAMTSTNKIMHRRVKSDAGTHIIRRLYDYYFESRTDGAVKEVSKILESLKFKEQDQIVLYSYWMHATAKIAVEIKKQFFNDSVSYSLTRAHRYDVEIDASPIHFLPEREYLLENLDQVFCVSTNSQNYLKETYPLYKDKVSLHRLGTAKKSEKPIAKKNPFILVSCSQLRKVKNIHKIIDALEIIEEKKDLEIKWVHFGNGPEFKKIKKLADVKLKKTIVYLPGHQSNKDVMTWYNENNPTAFINVSSSEGIPVSIMEAMSFGIPVIATDVGGNGEIVQEQLNGLLLKSAPSANQIANAIVSLNELCEFDYKDFSANAYNTWKKNYSSSNNYSSFSKMISFEKNNT